MAELCSQHERCTNFRKSSTKLRCQRDFFALMFESGQKEWDGWRQIERTKSTIKRSMSFSWNVEFFLCHLSADFSCLCCSMEWMHGEVFGEIGRHGWSLFVHSFINLDRSTVLSICSYRCRWSANFIYSVEHVDNKHFELFFGVQFRAEIKLICKKLEKKRLLICTKPF